MEYSFERISGANVIPSPIFTSAMAVSTFLQVNRMFGQKDAVSHIFLLIFPSILFVDNIIKGYEDKSDNEISVFASQKGAFPLRVDVMRFAYQKQSVQTM